MALNNKKPAITTLVSRSWWMYGLPVLVALICTFIALSPLRAAHEQAISIGITLDLTLTAPLAYFLLIPEGMTIKARLRSGLRVFLLGVLLAGLLLGHPGHGLLHVIRTWVAPAAEALVIGILIWKFYKAKQAIKAHRREQPLQIAATDFLSMARQLLTSVMGEKMGYAMASEVAVFYYLLTGHRRPIRPTQFTVSAPSAHLSLASLSPGPGDPARSIQFSMHKTSGVSSVLGVFLCCMIVEALAMHFLCRLWSHRAAWILTTLSGYTALQLYAHMRAIKMRPVQIMGDHLFVSNGLVADAMIPIANIECVRQPERRERFGKEIFRFALLKGLENQNMLVHLREPVTVVRMFGLRKKTTSFLFYVDEPGAFLAALHEEA